MGHREDLIAAMTVFLVVDTIAIASRLYVRTKMLSRGFGWDDVFLILTYVNPTFQVELVYVPCKGHDTDIAQTFRLASLSPVLWGSPHFTMATLLQINSHTTTQL